jgi:ribosomal protein L13
MAEKTEHTNKPFEGKIPEETRQHFRSAREEFRKSIEGMLPPEFTEHRRSARKEMLLAWRSMIDASLERMEEPKKKA